jgi:hypothetical protein
MAAIVAVVVVGAVAVGFAVGLVPPELRFASGFFGRKIPAPPPSSPPVSCARAAPEQIKIESERIAKQLIRLKCFRGL